VYEYVRGVLSERSPAHAIVDVGGVGYAASIPLTTYERLPAVGSTVRLLTVLVVREDSHRLYGFATPDERAFFLELQNVSGIGPAVALSIVSSMTYESFCAAVSSGDAALLRKTRGIGKRLSERMVVELRDRLAPASSPAIEAAGAEPAVRDALLALERLGFARPDAEEAVRAARADEPTAPDAGELVRRALRRL
jgi:Holliday junction DNA helicase RuvA